MMDNCYICESQLHIFMTTPVLKLPDGSFEQCCEECANREFPDWDNNDEDS